MSFLLTWVVVALSLMAPVVAAHAGSAKSGAGLGITTVPGWFMLTLLYGFLIGSLMLLLSPAVAYFFGGV